MIGPWTQCLSQQVEVSGNTSTILEYAVVQCGFDLSLENKLVIDLYRWWR